jgi:hypothetical protein
MRRDNVSPPFAQIALGTSLGCEPKRKADPADGFLAGLTQLVAQQNDDVSHI